MVIKDQNTKLEILVEEKTPVVVQGAGDFALRTSLSVRDGTIKFGEFTASTRSWIEIGKFNEFLRQLESLETARLGSAEIESMSPGEFRIRFYMKDGKGGIAAEGEVGHHVVGSNRINKVFFDVVLDPSLLRNILVEFKSLPSVS